MHDMAYDPIHDEIIVPQFFAFAILTFSGDADGDVAPIRKIFGPRTQLKNTHAVAVDPSTTRSSFRDDTVTTEFWSFPGRLMGMSPPFESWRTDRTPGRVAIDPVRNLLVVSGGPGLHVYDRTASGKAQPRNVITIPQSMGQEGYRPDGN